MQSPHVYFPLPLNFPLAATAPEAGFFKLFCTRRDILLKNVVFEVPDNHLFQPGAVPRFTLLITILKTQTAMALAAVTVKANVSTHFSIFHRLLASSSR